MIDRPSSNDLWMNGLRADDELHTLTHDGLIHRLYHRDDRGEDTRRRDYVCWRSDDLWFHMDFTPYFVWPSESSFRIWVMLRYPRRSFFNLNGPFTNRTFSSVAALMQYHNIDVGADTALTQVQALITLLGWDWETVAESYDMVSLK